jgi:ferredoxin-NADP reductase
MQFFVCGPPPMLESVVKTLRSLGVPVARIHTERFSFV